MNANTPDLVLRAAERLAVERDQSAQRIPRPFAEVPPTADPQKPPVIQRKSELQSIGRHVTISPAVLATNGIFLPSSDPGVALTFEEYRSIRRHVLSTIGRLEAASTGSTSRIALVTSARPADGKTFTSINLALSFASGGERRVILMDGDARRRSLVDYMGIKTELGWVDLLERDDLTLGDVLLHTNIPNLSVLPSGVPSHDLSDLVSSRKMTNLLAELTTREPDGIVLIDSLPCLVSNEPTMLAEQVGQVIFVVAANETTRDEVQASLRYLSGAPAVSLILNKGEPLMAEQFSKYGYYNYGRP